MIRFATIDTPLGPLLATGEAGALTGLYFAGARHAPAISTLWIEDPMHEPLRECARQLAGYFGGRLRRFDLPLELRGTPFQRAVWEQISRIPFGETLGYTELAGRCGTPLAVRAAGAATGRNPLSILVPCHRVVGARGALTGYAGGVERKMRLLQLEGAKHARAA